MEDLWDGEVGAEVRPRGWKGHGQGAGEGRPHEGSSGGGSTSTSAELVQADWSEPGVGGNRSRKGFSKKNNPWLISGQCLKLEILVATEKDVFKGKALPLVIASVSEAVY